MPWPRDVARFKKTVKRRLLFYGNAYLARVSMDYIFLLFSSMYARGQILVQFFPVFVKPAGRIDWLGDSALGPGEMNDDKLVIWKNKCY